MAKDVCPMKAHCLRTECQDDYPKCLIPEGLYPKEKVV